MRVAYNGREAHVATLRKVVEHCYAYHKVGGVVFYLPRTAKYIGKHKVKHKCGKQRVEKTPQNAQHRTLVLGFEISCHKLIYQKTVLCHVGKAIHNKICAVSAVAHNGDDKPCGNYRKTCKHNPPVICAQPNEILSLNGKVEGNVCFRYAVGKEKSFVRSNTVEGRPAVALHGEKQLRVCFLQRLVKVNLTYEIAVTKRCLLLRKHLTVVRTGKSHGNGGCLRKLGAFPPQTDFLNTLNGCGETLVKHIPLFVGGLNAVEFLFQGKFAVGRAIIQLLSHKKIQRSGNQHVGNKQAYKPKSNFLFG